MKEKWLVIQGFKEYRISNTGIIETSHIKGSRGKLGEWWPLKHFIKNGYPAIKLMAEGKSHAKYIHRLVAENFIKNPDNKRCVNHINFNRRDNNVNNLEWVTHAENLHHAIINNRCTYTIGENRPMAKLDDIKVMTAITLLKSKKTIISISNHYKVSASTISAIKNNKAWKHIPRI